MRLHNTAPPAASGLQALDVQTCRQGRATINCPGAATSARGRRSGIVVMDFSALIASSHTVFTVLRGVKGIGQAARWLAATVMGALAVELVTSDSRG